MFAVLSTSIFMWDIYGPNFKKKNMVLIISIFQDSSFNVFVHSMCIFLLRQACLLAKTYNDSDPYQCIASRSEALKVVSVDILRFKTLAFAKMHVELNFRNYRFNRKLKPSFSNPYIPSLSPISFVPHLISFTPSKL